MQKNQNNIHQRNPGEDLYGRLQRQSLEWLQGLAGDLWTDYNVHDPGMTISDVLNYALTELDYRLRFDRQDYLTGGSGELDYRAVGLFGAEEVFPVVPVTLQDYRKLMTDAVEEVDNLWIYPAEECGWYEILVELSPEAGAGSRERVHDEVTELFEGNRNLCEGLRQVLFVERKPLVLEADIGIAADVDVPQVLAEIYWEVLQFFVAGIRYRRVEECLAAGKTPEELLDGPELKHWAVDDDSLGALPCSYSVSRLYRCLAALKGVKEVRMLGFREDGQLYTDQITPERADCSYTVLIPAGKEECGVRLLIGDTPVELDFSRLPEMLYGGHARSYGCQNRTVDLAAFLPLPGGVHQEVYRHESVQNDFPEYYGINRMGVASGASELRKAQARQLKGYLLLFDEVFARGLRELELVPRLLDCGGETVREGVVPLSAPEVMWEQFVRTTAGADDVRQLREKERWADVLDRIYGEDSNPAWLKSYNLYEDSVEECQKRRFRFLSRVPEWGRNRFKGIHLRRNASCNVPGVKAYVAALLGFEPGGEQPVINVFPQYNLKLVTDDLFYRFRGQLLSHNLVSGEMIREENMEHIPLTDQVFTDQDYHLLRERLPLLHYNLLFEGLFREGIRMESFRLLNLTFQSDRLLVFYHRRKKEWINLGRFSSRKELVDTANCLRRFLVMLNRKSETLYVVEHLYLFTEEAFVVTVVFPGWSARMADPGFREACESIVCARLPAHIEVRFRWFSPGRMWKFEHVYYEWRRDLSAGGEGREIAGRLKEIIK